MKKFIRTLLRPDREETNPEADEIARAVNILQIGEFQLLQLAYKDWYGEELPESMTDRLFADYMLRKQVPHWARHYARRIDDWHQRDLLDANNPDYHRYDRSYSKTAPGGVRRFCVATAVLIIFVGGTLWVSHLATDGRTASVLPPYFEDGQSVPSRPRGAVGPGS
ncbi:MAG: hypothetical protein OXR03_00890 [Rhodospirillaceae bacterium]|nr:hypothetical protein [Rhodospirillaceae bacterium]